MRRASLIFLFLASPCFAWEKSDKMEAIEKDLGSKAQSLRDLLTGAPLSETARDNRLKKFHEIRGWDKKALAKSLGEGRAKAEAAVRKAAREAMEQAFAKAGGDAAELSKQAVKVRDEDI